MTRLLDEAVAIVARLPDQRQDELARVLRQLAGVEQPPYILTPEEHADLEAAEAEVARGELATGQVMTALDYVAGRSPQGAARIGDRLRDIATLLEDHPHTGRKADRPNLRFRPAGGSRSEHDVVSARLQRRRLHRRQDSRQTIPRSH